MTLENSGEHEYAHGIADTRMGFIFEISADGQVEVLVDAVNATGTHDLQTQDEIGWSNITAHQNNNLSVQILPPNTPDRSLAAMSRLHSTDISTNLHREFLIPGQHYFSHFVSTGAVTAGRSVVILMGTHNTDVFPCNDTGVDSDTSFHWLIKSVEVRIRP